VLTCTQAKLWLAKQEQNQAQTSNKRQKCVFKRHSCYRSIPARHDAGQCGSHALCLSPLARLFPCLNIRTCTRDLLNRSRWIVIDDGESRIHHTMHLHKAKAHSPTIRHKNNGVRGRRQHRSCAAQGLSRGKWPALGYGQ
jgi:hypothetical protein